MPLSENSEAMNNQLKNISRLYLDTNIFIYFLEGHRELGETVSRVFELCEEYGIAVFTSEITITECLMGPHKNKNAELIEKYEAFFHSAAGTIGILPTDSSILWETPHIAAKYRLKLVDSIHVATAVASGCDCFLTNDKGIGPFDTSMKALYLSDLIPKV